MLSSYGNKSTGLQGKSTKVRSSRPGVFCKSGTKKFRKIDSDTHVLESLFKINLQVSRLQLY